MVQALKQFIDDLEDRRLAGLAQKGDTAAFEKLVHRHQRRIYFTVRKLVVDADATHDVTQEVFIKVWRKLDQFDTALPLYPWLHRIAIHEALNHLRRNPGRRELPLEEGDGAWSDTAPAPDAALLQHELDAALSKALERLPEDQRTVFVLRTSEELSYQEIAEALDISMGTVMSRLSRARERLKKTLGPYLSQAAEAHHGM